ncbi:hypothetical protein JCM10295v2_005760 [Rhodotorula toruloides]
MSTVSTKARRSLPASALFTVTNDDERPAQHTADKTGGVAKDVAEQALGYLIGDKREQPEGKERRARAGLRKDGDGQA